MPPRPLALVVMVGAIASLVAGLLAYRGQVEGLPELQLSGTADAARAIVAEVGSIAPFQDALAADYRLIAGYTTFLVLVLVVGWQCFAGPSARRAAGGLAGIAVVAGLLDVGENLAVDRGLLGLAAVPDQNAWWVVAAAADTLKLVLLVPTAGAAIVTLLLIGGRMLRPPGRSSLCRVVPGSVVTGEPRGYLPDVVRVEGDRPARRPGVCVSGGGIRSACVTLGALQVLRANGRLTDAGYLFSVSGGGYMTGALRLAMQRPGTGNGARALSPDAYSESTPELAYMHAHGDYIAQGAVQWVRALGVVLAHLLYALFLLASLAVGVGLLLGLFYREFRIAGPGLAHAFDLRSPLGGDPLPTDHSPGATWTIGALLVLTVLLWLIAGAVEGLTGEPHPRWRGAAWVVAGLTLLVAVVTMLVPALVELVIWRPDVAKLTGSVGVIGSVLTTLKTLGSKASSGAPSGRSLAKATQYVWPVVVVIVVALIVFGMLLGMAATLDAVVQSRGDRPLLLYGLAAGVVVAGVAAKFFDQTSASLHPFYRRRLNSLYSRREGPDAVPYGYDERTKLSTYATSVDGYPRFVFVATAHVKEPGVATRPVPYTFSSNWVGGAHVGYVPTEALIDNSPPCYRGDLTLLGAVAISGAAFASAMGVVSKPFEVLLALSNARLGAWLPNPVRLGQDAAVAGGWTRRRLPRVRSESYHAREVFGSHPVDDPLLLITDGGHYDNLGLVEALRHRCETVVVVDSSNDTPPYPTTLIDAMTLADTELGVTIDLDDPDALAPGSVLADGDLPQPWESLLPRFSSSAVVTGTIHYPAGPLGPAWDGTLVVVKARLTLDLPYEVLAYAASNPDFPYDSTADQWFDAAQFDAYHRLGRRLGKVAVERLTGLGVPVSHSAA
ncbi:hypothetical protein LQ327_22605 [Actinomycetospora endophytica]|uniref:Patatin-like phospholipase n=1 Tax=Actinomycetospora endophytica TaxID=2291215 RepID=A0ABS8PDV1_9PSEU|nr:hypothetical protein [Actinomycetospora endophytica]MCD2196168.1 hypothetical protein [Actinomycetospora endophytica]